MSAWLISAGGALIVVAVLVDIFHTLANPGRQGWLSRHIHQAMWTMSHGPGLCRCWESSACEGCSLPSAGHSSTGPTCHKVSPFSEGAAAAHDPSFVDALYLLSDDLNTRVR